MKTIIYNTVEDLQAFRKTVKSPTMCLPADCTRTLSRGYITFILRDDNTEVEDSREYHVAPIYKSLEECKEIEHQSAETFFKARDDFFNDKETDMYPGDDTPRLRLGFAVYPQREWHTISISLLIDHAEFSKLQGRERYEMFTKKCS